MAEAALRREVTPPPLHVALPGRLAERVRELAEARGDQPSVFVAAAMARMVDDDLTEAVFDGDRAASAARDLDVGHGRQRFEALPGGLTMLQAGVVYVLGFHADADGVCRLPRKAFADIVGHGSQNHVASILPWLTGRDLALPVREKAGAVHWKLTRRGAAVFRELAGDKGG